MPTINYSVTQSIDTLAVNLSASEALVMNINNPLLGVSYFGLETIPNSDGVYTSSSPKNTSGSFTLGTGLLGVVKDDYKMGAVVSPGSNVLTFVPAQAVTGSTLRTRGIAAPPPSTGFDADAQAFFARVTSAGGVLTSIEQSSVNTLVLDMKSAGIWSAMKAIYPMVGASAAACAQNLKSSSFTGTFSSGWTFASTGVTPNGTSAFMNTGLNPSVSLSNFSAHHSLYTRTLLADLNGQGIFLTPGPNRMEFLAFSGILYCAIGASSQVSATNIVSLILGSRTSSTSNKIYTRGILRNNDTSTLSTDLPNLNYYLGASSNSSAAQFYNSKEIAFSSIGDGLTDQNATDLYNAVQTMNTTLLRQV